MKTFVYKTLFVFVCLFLLFQLTIGAKIRQLNYELEKSYSICNSGRKGPVFLDIPLDVQKANIKNNDLKATQKKFDKQVFDLKKAKSSIRKYLKDLKKSFHPGVELSFIYNMVRARTDLITSKRKKVKIQKNTMKFHKNISKIQNLEK